MVPNNRSVTGPKRQTNIFGRWFLGPFRLSVLWSMTFPKRACSCGCWQSFFLMPFLFLPFLRDLSGCRCASYFKRKKAQKDTWGGQIYATKAMASTA